LNQKQEALEREKAALEKAEREKREAEHRGMEVDHTRLLSTLANDEISLPAPTNLSRVDLINTALGNAGELISRARKLAAETGDARFDADASGYKKTEEELTHRASCLPPQPARATLFRPDQKRLWAGFSASGRKFGVVYTDRIEVYETNNYGRSPRVLMMDKLPARMPAHIVRARRDASRERLLFEVEYTHYARPVDAKEVKGSNGDFYKLNFEENREPVYGSEREILSWTLDETPPTSEGFSIRLRETSRTDPTGDADCGSLHLPEDGNTSLGRAASPPNKFGKFIKQKLNLSDSKKTPSSVLPIVHSADGKQGIYMVQAIINIDKDEDPIFHIFPALSYGSNVLPLDKGVIWAKDGNHLCDSETGEFPATDVKPNYAPAALDFAHGVAVLRGLLLRIKDDKVVSSSQIKLDWDNVRQVGITDGGEAVIVYFKDGGVALYDVEDATLRHRFLPVADARVTTVTPDGKQVILLRGDGRLESWSLSAFGVNGWATAQCPFKTSGWFGSSEAARIAANLDEADEGVSAASATGVTSGIELYEEALSTSDPTLLRGTLATGLDPNTKDYQGRSLVMRAIYCEDTSVAEALFSYGADLNAKDGDGAAALMLAANAGNVKVVEMLLSKEADVNITSKDGDTALSFAVNSRINNTNVPKCYPKIATALIAKGADTGIKLRGGMTLLMAAAESGVECTRILLDKVGTDANDKDNEGRNALFYAARNGHADALNMLLDAGTDLHAKSAYGVTPLMETLWAITNNGATELSAMHLLLERGADVNAKDADGRTALMQAAGAYKLAAVEKLLARAVKVNEQDKFGMTALMLAAERGDVEIVKALLQKGASTGIKNREGKTAAAIAEVNGHVEVARLLRESVKR
jgi:ankyrin repeat protein